MLFFYLFFCLFFIYFIYLVLFFFFFFNQNGTLNPTGMNLWAFSFFPHRYTLNFRDTPHIENNRWLNVEISKSTGKCLRGIFFFFICFISKSRCIFERQYCWEIVSVYKSIEYHMTQRINKQSFDIWIIYV